MTFLFRKRKREGVSEIPKEFVRGGKRHRLLFPDSRKKNLDTVVLGFLKCRFSIDLLNFSRVRGGRHVAAGGAGSSGGTRRFSIIRFSQAANAATADICPDLVMAGISVRKAAWYRSPRSRLSGFGVILVLPVATGSYMRTRTSPLFRSNSVSLVLICGVQKATFEAPGTGIGRQQPRRQPDDRAFVEIGNLLVTGARI